MRKLATNVSPTALEDLTTQEIADLGPQTLMDLAREVDEQIALWQRRAKKLDAGTLERYKEHIKPDQTGTTHLADGGFDAKVTIPKKVTWDQVALAGLPRAMRKRFVRTKYDVLETDYKRATPEEAKALDQARTVEPGRVSIEITAKD